MKDKLSIRNTKISINSDKTIGDMLRKLCASRLVKLKTFERKIMRIISGLRNTHDRDYINAKTPFCRTGGIGGRVHCRIRERAEVTMV